MRGRLLILLIFCIPLPALSVDLEKPDNFAAMKLLADDYAKLLSADISTSGAKEAELSIGLSPAAWLLEQAIVESPGGVRFVRDSARPFKASIAIEKYSVKFFDLRGAGLIERVTELKITGVLRMPDGELRALKAGNYEMRDTLTRAQAEAANATTHDFARGELPPERSFIKKYAEPVLAVAVSALAVFLFFTVRSN